MTTFSPAATLKESRRELAAQQKWLEDISGQSDGQFARPGLGAVAQLGERLTCTQEVAGSTPVSSTSAKRRAEARSGRGPVAQVARAHA